MIPVDVPLVICVTPDPELRTRLASQLNGIGAVLMVTDLPELQALLRPLNPLDGDQDRPQQNTSPHPDLVIDVTKRRVTWRGRSLSLTPLELDILCSLASQPLTVWTHERLYRAAWGGVYLGDVSTVHAGVKRLRRKLRAAGDGTLIETVRGVGYRLAVDDAAAA